MHALRPNDPTTLRLPARAGVAEPLGATPDNYWYHDFKRVDGWENFIEDAARPREGEEGTVTEDTVLVMNGGAHVSIYPSFFYYC